MFSVSLALHRCSVSRFPSLFIRLVFRLFPVLSLFSLSCDISLCSLFFRLFSSPFPPLISLSLPSHSERARNEGTERTWEYMAAHHPPQILLGDLNAEPDTDAIRFLSGTAELNGKRTASLFDAWTALYPEPRPGRECVCRFFSCLFLVFLPLSVLLVCTLSYLLFSRSVSFFIHAFERLAFSRFLSLTVCLSPFLSHFPSLSHSHTRFLSLLSHTFPSCLSTHALSPRLSSTFSSSVIPTDTHTPTAPLFSFHHYHPDRYAEDEERDPGLTFNLLHPKLQKRIDYAFVRSSGARVEPYLCDIQTYPR